MSPSLWFRCRYAIDTDSADWTVAENQIAKTGRGTSTVVSVKTSVDKKRKLDTVSSEGGGDEKRAKVKEDKKTRRREKVKR